MSEDIRTALAALDAEGPEDIVAGLIRAAAHAHANRAMDVAVPRMGCRTLIPWRAEVNALACAVASTPPRPSNVVDLGDAARRRRLQREESAWDHAARTMFGGDVLAAIASPARAREHAAMISARPLEETNTEVQRLRADLNDLQAAHRILLEHLRSKGAR